MRLKHDESIESPQKIAARIVHLLRRLIEQIPVTDRCTDELLEVLVQLNALPLATDEFAVATSRLQNARRYLVSGERGAANYELRLLLGSLQEKETRRTNRR